MVGGAAGRKNNKSKSTKRTNINQYTNTTNKTIDEAHKTLKQGVLFPPLFFPLKN